MPDDLAWLGRALWVAERGRHRSAPNPFVGCVLVRDGRVVGEGATGRPGEGHAEVAALAAAGPAARGATAYVTLEPCDHAGRTGPCSRALLDAGVARVVVADRDPTDLARGGLARLAAAGVEVTVVDGFAPWVAVQQERWRRTADRGDGRPRRPWVTLKLAQTGAGELAVPGRRWVTGPVARAAVHAERARHDAVLVGSGTVLADDPRLDVRAAPLPAGRGQPRPVVLDGRGRTPPSARVVARGALVLTCAGDGAWRGALRARGAEVVDVAAAPGGGVALDVVLAHLSGAGLHAVYAEPGATLAAALVAAGVVDEVVLHVADGRGAAAPPRPAVPLGAMQLRSHRPLGDDREWRFAPPPARV